MKKFLVIMIGLAIFIAAPVSMVAQQLGASGALSGLIGLVSVPSVMALVKLLPSIRIPGVHLAGVEVEVWTEYISNNLFKGVEFLKNCWRSDQYVLQGKVVHIPQAGSKPTVVKNRSTIPATAVKRNDTDIVYALDEYTTDPTVIEDAANVQLSYDKMSSVIGDHIGALNETICDNILFAWAPSASTSILRTTGATTYAAHTTGGTGVRKGFTLSDLKKAKVALDKQNVSKVGRCALMSYDMWAQLEDELKATNAKDFSLLNDATNGVIAKLYGFDITATNSTVIYTNAATPVVRAVGALGAATDNDAVFCYQKDCVELALGEIKFFEQTNHPQMYGDVYSGLVRMGGRKRYENGLGIVAIVQEP
jgi:hypothetical protein